MSLCGQIAEERDLWTPLPEPATIMETSTAFAVYLRRVGAICP
jgi:hypothetical protein